MTDRRLQIRSISREGIDDVRAWLVGRVRHAVSEGRGAPAIVIVRPHSVDLAAVAQVRATGLPLPWFLAGLTASTTDAGGPVEALGIAGRVKRQRAGDAPDGEAATVFLEWEDCAWWQWQVLVEGRRILEDTVTERSAAAGDPLPAGVGRWWSTARVRGMRVGLHPPLPPMTPGETVH